MPCLSDALTIPLPLSPPSLVFSLVLPPSLVCFSLRPSVPPSIVSPSVPPSVPLPPSVGRAGGGVSQLHVQGRVGRGWAHGGGGERVWRHRRVLTDARGRLSLPRRSLLRQHHRVRLHPKRNPKSEIRNPSPEPEIERESAESWKERAVARVGYGSGCLSAVSSHAVCGTDRAYGATRSTVLTQYGATLSTVLTYRVVLPTHSTDRAYDTPRCAVLTYHMVVCVAQY
eukprot:3288332-Rhodomonas_salina.2